MGDLLHEQNAHSGLPIVRDRFPGLRFATPWAVLERFTIEMSSICDREDKADKERERSHSGLRRVLVTRAADAATSRLATDQS